MEVLKNCENYFVKKTNKLIRLSIVQNVYLWFVVLKFQVAGL